MLLAILIILVLLFVVLPIIGLALWAFFTTILVGLVIGGLARAVLPGRQSIGLLGTVAAGLCGSIVGGFLGQHVFDVGGFATVLIEVALAAAVVAVVSNSHTRRIGSGI